MVRLILPTLIIVIVHGAINDICGQPPDDCAALRCACMQNPDGIDYGCCGQCYEQADGTCDGKKVDQYDYTCGGIAGLTCATGYECIYDTSACDPTKGGADCSGICNPTTTGSCPLDAPTTVDACDFKGICEYGEESCCGETHPSLICECAADGTTQSTLCHPSDLCLMPPCEQDYSGDFCGGIAAIPCGWTDYRCVDNPDDQCDPNNGGADCGGICRKYCGGKAGLTCPTDYECIDDPTDDCDPNKGGVDCGGICDPIPDPDGDVCGTILGLTCPTDYTCIYDITLCDPNNGGADCGGICRKYCGGIAAIECPTGYECTDIIGDDCDPTKNGADCPSYCASCTKMCMQIYDPVCCNGVKYSNLCSAESNCISADECVPGTCPVFCTADVYTCCDGSYVSRDPENSCEFASCPDCCGGIQGLTCQRNYECIDIPNDGCDPDNGGADCLGICELDICQLDKEVGPCDAIFPRYFYNSLTGTCEAFDYGGCDGNENNFESLEDCEKACDSPVFCTKDAQMCCDGSYVSRDPENNCEFAPCPDCCGGIQGLTCDTGYECIDIPNDGCDPDNGGADCFGICELDICQLKADVGPCKAAFSRYFYNSDSDACEEFTYGGCDGNGNNFETVEDCKKECDSELIFCTEDAQMCCDGSYVSRDPENNCEFAPCPYCCGGIQGLTCDTGYECIDIANDGCDPDNGGADCFGICELDICELKADVGPCRAAFSRYFYNLDSGECEEFTYGGCEGNGNNFETVEDCKKECGDSEIFCTEDAKMCCDGSYVSRDPENNCEFKSCPDCQFCGGIQGLTCPDGQTCITDCGGPENVGADCGGECYLINDVCQLPMEVGPCEAAMPRYYYNTKTEKCEEFTYGGCEGNGNNFETMEKCQNSCDDIDICALAEDSGSCKANFNRFFYNAKTGECEEFIWGGCEGNANNFEKQEDCENSCAETECVIPEDPFKYEALEDEVCRFCFAHGNGKRCKKIPYDWVESDYDLVESDYEVLTDWWVNYGWIVNIIKNEPECLLEYCKGKNTDLRADCEVEDVRLKKMTGKLTVDDCGCNLIECITPTARSDVGRLEVLIVIVLVLTAISWMYM